MTVRQRAAVTWVAVGCAYLAASVAVWWHVWTGHPTSEMTCGCGDPALFVWSFGWFAHAIAHGHNPFLSGAIFHPDGMNLLANATAPLEGFLLAPVTWLFGPVASVNAANTIAPAASALSTCWAVRRGLRTGWLGAFVAGLVVELSPAVIGSAAVSHLQINLLAFVPVIAVCLHELLVRQDGSPWRWGLLLAAATVGQFFAGTEMLVIAALFAAALVVAWGVHLLVLRIQRSPVAAARGAHALRGLTVASVASTVLLAGPAWFALAGPRSFSGAPWPGRDAGTTLRGTVFTGAAHELDPLIHLAGYPGPAGAPPNYLGVAVLLAALAAVVLLWRRPAVWVLAALAFAADWLSLGTTWHPLGTDQPWWVPFLPWTLLHKAPVVGGVLAQNIVVVTVLSAAALVALLVDRVARIGRGRGRMATAGLAVAISAVVVAPLVTAWTVPLSVAPIGVPAWFVHQAPRLPAGAVVLAYPYVGPPGESEAMVWQSVDGMHFALAGGCCLVPGPDGKVDHGDAPGSAGHILGRLTSPLVGPRPALDDHAAMAAVRSALARWRVTTVVVTDHGLDRGTDPDYARRWFTALLGRPPVLQDGASVWTLGST